MFYFLVAITISLALLFCFSDEYIHRKVFVGIVSLILVILLLGFRPIVWPFAAIWNIILVIYFKMNDYGL